MASKGESPRQKMINLMYLVFIAMLALNVSSEVLDGFELVEEGLLRSVKSSTQNNERIFGDLESYYASNPEKTKQWYESAAQVKEKTDTLFNYIQELKVKIVKHADGDEGDPEHLKHPDDLNASLEVMFERGKNDVEKLKKDIDSYREFISQLVTNPVIKEIIESNLSTEPSAKAKANEQTWEESMFWRMPLAASVTLLTKIQNDVRSAEGEVLTDLLKNIDVTDYRVNKIEAFVIPESQTVMRGGSYKADIVLSAQDSTLRPRTFVNGKYLPDNANGRFVAGTGATGRFPVTGYIEMPRGDGSFQRQNFSTEYFVVEPSATVAPLMMNVLYAGINNEIRIAVPGVASQNVSATMSNGTLTSKGNDIWVAKPAKVGTEAIVTVTARMADGRTAEMAKTSFRVRALPPPTAFLTIKDANGNPTKFDTGAISKGALSAVESLEAAIDDGLLNIRFNVLSFEWTTFDQFGNSMREKSNGARFSPAQKERIRTLQRGKTVLISRIVTKGPDGIEQSLRTSMEIIIN